MKAAENRFPAGITLPGVPQTTSPVPWLTSLHLTPGRGSYGDAAYPGNCSGLLIKDLLAYYRPKSVMDPMTGSGTCRDVCTELGIRCDSFDLRTGFDATDSENFRGRGPYDFVWLHPPYFQMVRYSDDPRCLSNSANLDHFLTSLWQVIRNCTRVLSDNGKLAILMGDARIRGQYLALPFRTMSLAMAEGLTLAAPEIIRFSFGSTSSHRKYNFSFIPRIHDVCLLLKKGQQCDSDRENAILDTPRQTRYSRKTGNNSRSRTPDCTLVQTNLGVASPNYA